MVSLTSETKLWTLAMSVTVLKMVCLKFVPSDVQTCLEFLPSGGFTVLLASGVKLQTFVVSITGLKGGMSGVVDSFRWVRGLTGLRSEAADLCSKCYSL